VDDSSVDRILLKGAQARGALVPKLVLTKSSRSKSHLALGLQKRIWLKIFLQQPATVTVISALICVKGLEVLIKIDLTYTSNVKLYGLL